MPADGNPLIKLAIKDKRNVVPVVVSNLAVVKFADNYYFPLVLILLKSSTISLFMRFSFSEIRIPPFHLMFVYGEKQSATGKLCHWNSKN